MKKEILIYYSNLSLKGGALVYVLLLTTLISSIFAALLLINSYQHQLQNKLYYQKLSRENLDSGLALILHRENPNANAFALQLYNTPDDSLYAQAEYWGLFKLMHIKAKHKNTYTKRSALLGELIPKKYQFSLQLKDERQPLSLGGKASIRGKALLPNAGIRTAFIAGQSFTGSLPAETEINSRQTTIQYGRSRGAINDALRKVAKGTQNAEVFSLQNMHRAIPWEDNAFKYYSPYSLRIENSSFIGKCIIQSDNRLSLYPSSQIESALLFAKEIHIKKGFQGRIQAYATEKIIVEKGVKLEYPSVLFLAKIKQPIYLKLATEAELEGALIFDAGFFYSQPSREDYVKISAGATLSGNLFASYNLDIQGHVKGNCYTGNFLYRSPASSYRNHLFDGELDYQGLSPKYVAPLIYGEKQIRLVQWLNPID